MPDPFAGMSWHETEHKGYTCPRCRDVRLIGVLGSAYECPQCRRLYCNSRPEGPLHEKWPGPLGVALWSYYERGSSADPHAVAEALTRQNPRESVQEILREIKLELDDPVQQVREIFDMSQSEEEVRGYLRELALQLEALLSKGE